MTRSKASLLLFPNLLGEHKHHQPFLPSSVDRAIAGIDGLIAESETAGRRFLGRFELERDAREIPIAVFDKRSSDEDLDFFLEPLAAGETWGLVSDGGLPCVADPGSRLVWRARQRGIPVKAFVGPSALMLALMLSGLPGQQFSCHGYLAKDAANRKKELVALESASRRDGMTQIFIEAPYRNDHMLDSLLEVLDAKTHLCVAWDLTLPTQGVVSQEVSVWRKTARPNLGKKPATFLLSAPKS